MYKYVSMMAMEIGIIIMDIIIISIRVFILFLMELAIRLVIVQAILHYLISKEIMKVQEQQELQLI